MAALGAIDVSEVHYAPSGHVYIAAVGSAAPTDATTALTTAWYDVGYVTEDGVSITPAVDLGDIRAWQSVTRLKRTVNTIDIDVSFKMMQINKTILSTFFFGGTTTQQPGGAATLNLPSAINIAALTWALCIDWTADTGEANRFYFPRGVIGDREAMQLLRTDAVVCGVTFSVTDNSGSFGSHFSNNNDLYS